MLVPGGLPTLPLEAWVLDPGLLVGRCLVLIKICMSTGSSTHPRMFKRNFLCLMSLHLAGGEVSARLEAGGGTAGEDDPSPPSVTCLSTTTAFAGCCESCKGTYTLEAYMALQTQVADIVPKPYINPKPYNPISPINPKPYTPSCQGAEFDLKDLCRAGVAGNACSVCHFGRKEGG